MIIYWFSCMFCNQWMYSVTNHILIAIALALGCLVNVLYYCNIKWCPIPELLPEKKSVSITH